ncbi:hypothetical protein EG352_05700 [Chryseobacterium indologenes]|uniref:Uncharacterized protein n=1 Tax=Chryseobacterium indologenes TaxID=253 RepID=A0AAD0YUG6_CHRID|nr:hypothetical protein CEQ15_08690 [Chryseobacterium indologenes]AZB17298.1 hypothetical protein EG352_05700 [Chryseobacterium indologenes]GAE64431.1 hypothetical protein CIN01S_07_03560 [Chryseobacterium indologenes NBRC 14944]VFA41109.1 Uncharacterised protein [Chryseobacterium indologenes]
MIVIISPIYQGELYNNKPSGKGGFISARTKSNDENLVISNVLIMYFMHYEYNHNVNFYVKNEFLWYMCEK